MKFLEEEKRLTQRAKGNWHKVGNGINKTSVLTGKGAGEAIDKFKFNI